MASAVRLQIPKGVAMNRPIFGGALIVGALFWWLSGAALLVYEGKFYFMFSLITVLAFFVGLAFLVPMPAAATRLNQHRFLGSVLVWLGLVLGICHPLALKLTAAWPEGLLKFYAAFGLTGGTSVQ